MTRASVYQAQYGLKKHKNLIAKASAFVCFVYFVVNKK
jgi:hypothetical protein